MLCELRSEQASLTLGELSDRLDLADPIVRKKPAALDAAPMPLAGQQLRHRPLPASAGGSRMTSATDSCPAPIRRFNCARAHLISFARSSATSRSGTATIVAVSVIRVPLVP